MSFPLLAVPLYTPDMELGMCLPVQSLLSTSQLAAGLGALQSQGLQEGSCFQAGLDIPARASAMNPRPGTAAKFLLLEVYKHRREREEIKVPSSRQGCDQYIPVPNPAFGYWSMLHLILGQWRSCGIVNHKPKRTTKH